MTKPCEHCEKADNRTGYFKCDKPCNNAKQCYKADKELIRVLMEGVHQRIETLEVEE